jgi:phosphohistidine phosphatase SixA
LRVGGDIHRRTVCPYGIDQQGITVCEREVRSQRRISGEFVGSARPAAAIARRRRKQKERASHSSIHVSDCYHHVAFCTNGHERLFFRAYMISNLRIPVTLAVFAIGCTSAPAPEPPIVPTDRGETIVYLVRHAEKSADNPADPELSPAGYVRADSLAMQLRDAGINVIITTHLKRTALTARPLARLRGITPEIVPVSSPTSAHIDSVTAAVRRHPGATILVVGHSNTIGHIARRLSGERVGDLCDHEYSRLFIVSMPRAKPPQMLVDRYGPPDPPSDGSCVPMQLSR